MPEPFNQIMIWADDMIDPWYFRDNLGGSILTPNLDAFCARATRLENAYAISPICMPSRAATMTGYSPPESGVMSNGDDDWYLKVPTRDNVSSIMKRAGYHIRWAGKIQHGYGLQPPAQREQLYDQDWGTFTFQPDTTPGLPGVIHYHPDVSDAVSVEGKDNEFYDYQVAQYGIDSIASFTATPPGKPWALFLGFKHPHNSLEAPKWAYDAVDVSSLVAPPAFLDSRNTQIPTDFGRRYTSFINKERPQDGLEAWQHHVRAYYACIYHIDHHFGRLMAALDASPFADNTVVYFLSDHGFSLGNKSWWGKYQQYEESARTPFLMRAPGQTTAKVETAAVSMMDAMPTLLDYAGIPIPKRLAGQSLRKLMPGETDTYERRGALSFIHASASIAATVNGVRYRFIFYPNGEMELYNLENDRNNATNLINSVSQTLIDELKSRLVIEQARYGMVQPHPDLPSPKSAAIYALYGGDTVQLGAGDDTIHMYGFDDERLPTIKSGGGRNKLLLAGWGTSKDFTMPEGIYDLEVRVQQGTGTSSNIRGNDLGNRMRAPQLSPNTTYGGAGNDYIDNTGSFVYAGAGDDTIISGARQWGGPGNDQMEGGREMYGEDGDDLIRRPSSAGALIDGGSGNDTITGGTGPDTIYGGTGNDSIDGGNGDDIIYGGPGQSTLRGGAGNDTIHAVGNDSVFGGSGSNTFIIGPAAYVTLGDWSASDTINITSWGTGGTTYRNTTPGQVFIENGHRGVLVSQSGGGALTVAQVQATVVGA